MEWTFTLQNWRGIRELEWSPYGVCLLAGPNGSGKTSVLSALRFLRNAYVRDVASALQWEGYPGVLRHMQVDERENVRLTLSVGERRWELELAMDGEGVHPYHGEAFFDGESVIFRREALQRTLLYKDVERTTEEQVFLRLAHGLNDEPSFAPFVTFLSSIRVYGTYHLNRVREVETGQGKATFLHPLGKNLFTVLRNWKSAPRMHGDRFAWVLEALKDAFPDQVEDIEFDTIGEVVSARFYPPNAPEPNVSLPIGVAADGFLTGLLHLTAVAGAEPGSVLAFDEMENQLHPHAIRSILASMRERAEVHNLTVILTTHSPVLMNAFKGYEEQFFVLQPEHAPLPVALDELKDPDWLAHFALGDLYIREDFGAPQSPEG